MSNSPPNLSDVLALLSPHFLDLMGGFHPDASEDLGASFLLLGPKEPGFWAHFTQSPEYTDGQPDPIDRWSARVISGIAAELGGSAYFPFGGPPYRPFIGWALRTGRVWQSPAGPLVHDRAGMMVSFRGAIALPFAVDFAESVSPCAGCAAPCVSTCPVGALSAETGYDVAACHGFLDTPAGAECMNGGCLARRACPVSRSYGRDPVQSGFHMRSFHPTSIADA